MASQTGVNLMNALENQRSHLANEAIAAQTLAETVRNNQAVIDKEYAKISQQERASVRDYFAELQKIAEEWRHNQMTEQQARDELEALNSRFEKEIKSKEYIAKINNGMITFSVPNPTPGGRPLTYTVNPYAYGQIGLDTVQDFITFAKANGFKLPGTVFPDPSSKEYEGKFSTGFNRRNSGDDDPQYNNANDRYSRKRDDSYEDVSSPSNAKKGSKITSRTEEKNEVTSSEGTKDPQVHAGSQVIYGGGQGNIREAARRGGNDRVSTQNKSESTSGFERSWDLGPGFEE